MEGLSIVIAHGAAQVRAQLRALLFAERAACVEAANVTQLQRALNGRRVNLILLDAQLPGGCALAWLEAARAAASTARLPVIALVAVAGSAGAENDRGVRALEAGADDYLTQPLSHRELLARMQAILRRSEGIAREETLQCAGVQLELVNRRVLVERQPVTVGPTEFKLLKMFMLNRGRAFSRDQLLNQVWPTNTAVGTRTIDVHIQRLRKALHTSTVDYSSLIQTVHGVGYRFANEL